MSIAACVLLIVLGELAPTERRVGASIFRSFRV
jgi:hypothetical protein